MREKMGPISSELMFLVLSHFVVAILALPPAIHQSASCTIQNHGLVHQDWVYTAPPRYVPAPPVDPALQQEFFRLFMDQSNYTKSLVQNEPLPPGISRLDLDFIARVCPKSAFFYSMSPQHVVARNMLQRYLASLPSANELVRVARIILHNHEINPKIWYYALMGAVMDRPDMNGLMVAQPLDAIPDLFLPVQIISEALSRYRVVYGIGNDLGFGSIGGGGGGGGGPGGFQYLDHHGAHSSVSVKKVKLDRKLRLDMGNSSSESSSASSERRNRNKASRRQNKARARNSSGRRRSSEVSGESHQEEQFTSAASTSPFSRPNAIKANGNAGRQSSTESRQVKSLEQSGEFGHRLSYGEDDDDYDELRRIHDTSGNSTRQIRQRRERRLKKKRTPGRTKRQLFGSTPLFQHHGVRDCIVVNGTVGAANGVENKLWYFREDLMVNQHHWYWHQMYPVNATRHGDRRAELFFFVHRNLVARYNAERLANGMPRTVELLLRHGSVIEDGYDSHLIDMNSRKFWTPRLPNCHLTDILHEEDTDFARNIFLKDLTDLYYKLVFSIKDGALVGPNLQAVPLRNFQGVDHLGNAIEATELSINPLYYDSIGIHNLGHQVLGLAQDPQFISRLPTGVMGDTATTMRDPVFYTFHSGIDNVFDRHKRTLRPYQLYDGEFPLVWAGVEIQSVELAPHLNDGHTNRLRTFWSLDRFPLESGIDHSIHNGELREDICSMHLNHEPFSFKIAINVNPCVQSLSSQGTVRIFMAPRFDEYGQRFPLKVQRRLMFQLDAFPVQLHSGRNIIFRRSQDSALTKPWPPSLQQQMYQKSGAAGGGGGPNGGADYCGCGWPRHLLLPKGTPQGMHFDLFVMVTNYDEDIVQNSLDDLKIPEPCNSPYLFCGVPWRRYPDARPMGYPFDRLPYQVPVGCSAATGFPDIVCKMIQPQWYRSVESLEEYVHPAPNMAATVVVVQHIDTLVS